MTTQTDRITPEELRAEFNALHADLATLHADLAALRDGLKAAAAAPVGTYQNFEMTEIIMSYDDAGEPTYKGKGIPYLKFGVRIWPEILPALGIDPDTLVPGPNAITRQVRAEMVQIDGDNGVPKLTPRKIIGLATPAQA